MFTEGIWGSDPVPLEDSVTKDFFLPLMSSFLPVEFLILRAI